MLKLLIIATFCLGVAFSMGGIPDRCVEEDPDYCFYDYDEYEYVNENGEPCAEEYPDVNIPEECRKKIPAPQEPSDNACPLPSYLGFVGEVKPLYECDKMDKFAAPPCQIPGYRGNDPMVCCPVNVPDILFECDPLLYTNYSASEAKLLCGLSELVTSTECSSDCVPLNQCGAQNFDQEIPPQFCGHNNDGEATYCCDKPSGGNIQKPKAQFPLNGVARQCEDHSPLCADWTNLQPDSCTNTCNPSFMFMNKVCMDSCGTCKDKGCIDEYEKCQTWSRKGFCSVHPEFMHFNCRESCGTCGFKSPYNKEVQTKDGKQYTNPGKDYFDCGRNKKLTKERTPTDFNGIDGSKCGSVIISDRFLLTAAQCIKEDLAAGKTKAITIRDGTEHQEIIGVRRHHLHPTYYSHYLYNDLAIVELERRIIFDYDQFGDSPPCLDASEDIDDIANLPAKVQGLGNIDSALQLSEVTVKTMSNDNCEEWMRHNSSNSGQFRNYLLNNLGQYIPIADDILCTRGNPIENNGEITYTGPCEEDSGAPLYINEKIDADGNISGQTLAAIFSGGHTCGSELEPSFWNRIATQKKWIECTSLHLGSNPFTPYLQTYDVWRECQHHGHDNPCWDRVSQKDLCERR